jgi:hypothetical protein
MFLAVSAWDAPMAWCYKIGILMLIVGVIVALLGSLGGSIQVRRTGAVIAQLGLVIFLIPILYTFLWFFSH